MNESSRLSQFNDSTQMKNDKKNMSSISFPFYSGYFLIKYQFVCAMIYFPRKWAPFHLIFHALCFKRTHFTHWINREFHSIYTLAADVNVQHCFAGAEEVLTINVIIIELVGCLCCCVYVCFVLFFKWMEFCDAVSANWHFHQATFMLDDSYII